MTPKRVVITGGSGFIGANLARRVLREGHSLHFLLRPSYTAWRIEELKDKARFHLVDFTKVVDLHRALREIKPDWIFHLAAYGAYSFQNDSHLIAQTNFNNTVNLADAACETGFETFVNTGSSSEYGFKGRPTSEEDVLEPNSAYAVTKVKSTLYCQQTARTRNLRMPTLRLYSAYGPFEDPLRLIPTLVRFGLEGHLPPLVQPQIARDFVYVDDICDGFLAAAARSLDDPGAVVNLGTGVQTHLSELISLVRQLFAIIEEPRWGVMPDRAWDTDMWVADVRKAERLLGWRAVTSLRDGLARTADWYRENTAQLDPAKSAADSCCLTGK